MILEFYMVFELFGWAFILLIKMLSGKRLKVKHNEGNGDDPEFQ